MLNLKISEKNGEKKKEFKEHLGELSDELLNRIYICTHTHT